MNNTASKPTFTKYQVFVIAILAFIQFTVVLDFMVLSPLSAILLDKLHINTSQFGFVVSAYAFSAGASGLLSAGFADKYDRKKLLMFFYTGFIIGTILCGLAPNYQFLLIARIVTGIFGGVISSIGLAIVTDIFKMEQRGRVMGFVQMAFAASQVLGIPVGLFLANRWGWHSPFLMIAGLGIAVGIIMTIYLKPVNEHLKYKSDRNPFHHLASTLVKTPYARGFLATTLLATGGFMLMPFGSAFGIHNMGLTMEQLPTLYLVSGMFAMVIGPLAGKLSDKIGKYKVFFLGTVISIIMVLYYTRLGITPLWGVILINIFMFAGITSRMIASSALMTAVPDPQDRGAFMSINSSVQQISGGIAAACAGQIVAQTSTGYLKHYDTLGYVVTVSMLITLGMMYIINRQVQQKLKPRESPVVQPEGA
ncbi:MFS transporter [Danxiaibacter flavus]|uniref:MFS transporter n=1 Tax=Danxiaibacter flavus TaxID=3049108 RepID=A0ABV3ZHW2_9BACT|nr:MFS transporter [Chitinophagaceae bacterium DXS]